MPANIRQCPSIPSKSRVFFTISGLYSNNFCVYCYFKFILEYRANRYDLKGKLFLKTVEKYYIVDTGIRNQLTGLRNTDYGHVLENVIYFELLRRGFTVSTGKIGTLEVDFIATSSKLKEEFTI